MAFSLDCSSLADFTLTGNSANITISSSVGNPAPSIMAANNGFTSGLYKDTSIIWGQDGIEFDIQLSAGGYGYINLFNNGSCAGPILIFTNESGGVGNLSNTTGYNATSFTRIAAFIASEQVTISGNFIKYRVYTRQVDTAYQMKVVRVDQTLGEVSVLDWTTFSPNGYYFGLTARGFGAYYLDNLKSFRTSTINGVATLSNGSPASLVKCYSMISGQDYLVGSATPDSSGNYTLSVNTGDYLVVALGPSGYRPQAHLVTAP